MSKRERQEEEDEEEDLDPAVQQPTQMRSGSSSCTTRRRRGRLIRWTAAQRPRWQKSCQTQSLQLLSNGSCCHKPRKEAQPAISRAA